MTAAPDPLERLRAMNPVPGAVPPDWDAVAERALRGSFAAPEPTRAADAGNEPRGVRFGLRSGAAARMRTATASWGVAAAHGQTAAVRMRTAAAYGGRGVRGALAGLALCAAIAAGVLLAVAPWSGSPGFLARAAAALTAAPGTVLYERWEKIITHEPGSPAYVGGARLGPEQLWVQGSPPHRYRTVLAPYRKAVAVGRSGGAGLARIYGVMLSYESSAPKAAAGKAGKRAPGGRAARPLPASSARGRARGAAGVGGPLRELQVALSGRPLELGGTLQPRTGRAMPGAIPRTLTFQPPNELLSARLSVALGASLPGPHDQILEEDADPVSALRAAIAQGRAHEAGTTQFEGRTVQRIDISLPGHPPAGASPLPANAPKIHVEAYAYVEPETFRPVEIVFGLDRYRFLAYEYLPATPANLALTSVRAQHPDALVVRASAGRRSAGPRPG